MTQEKKKPKLETIQTLRALSIISVLVYHTSYWASKGDLGVHIFFVISGYLMAMILSKTGVTLESTKDFYLRRVKRIVPLYLITLLGIQIGSSLLLTKDKHRRTTQDTILALIFARNMHFEWDNISPSIHLWTVSTEMQYYLIVPIIFYFLLPMSYWKKLVMMGMIGAGSCLLYMTLPLVTGIYFMPSRLFEFLLGSLTFFTEIEIRKFFDKRSANSIPEKSIPDIVLNSAKRESFLGAIKSQFSKENLCSSISLLFFLISCVFCFLLTGTSEKNDVFIVLLCAAGTIFFANIGNELLINHQVLSYIGDISYVLYLVHFPIYVFLSEGQLHLHFPEVKDFFYAITLTILISALLHHTLEEFFIKTSTKIAFCYIGALYFLISIIILCEQIFDPNALTIDFKYGHFIFDE